MILFAISHPMCLMHIMALRYTKFEHEDCVLIAPMNTVKKEHCDGFVEHGIFKQVFRYKEVFGGAFTNKKDYINGIVTYYNDFIKVNNIDLIEYKEIILGADVYNTIAIYLSFIDIKYSLLEAITGMFQSECVYYNTNVLFGVPLWESELHLKYRALTGESEYTSKRYLNTAEGNKVIDEKDEYINFTKDFFNIKSKYKQNICNSFAILPCDSSNICLHMSTSSAVIEAYSVNHSIYFLNQIMIDYYLDDAYKNLIKIHPLLANINLKLYFNSNSVDILETEIPIEFYVLQENFRINKLVFTETSGFDKIINFIDEYIELGVDFIKNFRDMQKLYTIFEIDKQLGQFRDYFYHGTNEQMIINVKNYIFNNEKPLHKSHIGMISGNTIHIIDRFNDTTDYDLIHRSMDQCYFVTKIIFMNTDESFDFLNCFDEALFEYLIPISIKKRRIKHDGLDECKDETIYIFCKNIEVREQIQSLAFSKLLDNAGFEFYIEPQTRLEIYKKRETIKHILLEKLATKNITSQDISTEINSITKKQLELQDSINKLSEYIKDLPNI